MPTCRDCYHWNFESWNPFGHECSLEHNVDDGSRTDASDCPDYDGPEDDGDNDND